MQEISCTAPSRPLPAPICALAAARIGLRKMGEKSEAFCRQAMLLLSQNPELVPANVTAAAPETALGSDVMVASLAVYGQLKLTGGGEGLRELRRNLGMRFTKTSKPEEAKAA
jgi:hypothetical protein